MKECIKCGQVFQGSDWQCPWCQFQPALIEGRPAFAPDLASRSEGFEPVFFDQLYDLESKSFWFRSRNQLILWALQMYFETFESFLEIGCGTGFVLSAVERAFPHARLMGSELFSNGLSYAAKRIGKGELFQTDARKIPFREEFDVIGAFDVLEHIEGDVDVLRQIHKALKNGGGIILTVPQHEILWSRIDDYSHHVRRYTADDLKQKVERAGFHISRMTSFVTLLLPLMMLSRSRVKMKDNNPFDPVRELRISGWKNAVLEQALTMERWLIRMGINLSFGGSLLLIARKQTI